MSKGPPSISAEEHRPPGGARETAEAAKQETLANAAERLLRASAYRLVRQVTCEQSAEFLILRGRVSSWHEKQLAQETVRQLRPGLEIVNLLRVDPPRRAGRFGGRAT